MNKTSQVLVTVLEDFFATEKSIFPSSLEFLSCHKFL